MERTPGLLSRIAERVLSWVALGLLIALGWAIYSMAPETRQAILAGIWRTIVWLVVVAAVPWSAKLYITRVLEAGSNWASLALIVALTAVDALAGVLLLTGWPGGLWSWLAAITALGCAAAYNYLVAEYLAETAGG